MAQRGGLLEPARPYQLPSGQYWAIVPVLRPARIYDLRSTFASNALAAGVSVFELAMIMGTSGAMIERHYGRLIRGRRGRYRPSPGRLRSDARSQWRCSGER
jgi:hypothetical protein